MVAIPRGELKQICPVIVKSIYKKKKIAFRKYLDPMTAEFERRVARHASSCRAWRFSARDAICRQNSWAVSWDDSFIASNVLRLTAKRGMRTHVTNTVAQADHSVSISSTSVSPFMISRSNIVA